MAKPKETILDLELTDLTFAQLGEAFFELEKDHYKEKPVGIDEFVLSDEFLNFEFQGKFYPYWLEQLRKIHPTPVYSPYNEILTSQPIGSGKSTSSLVSIAYEIYKMFCLKNPHEKFGIVPSTVKFVFMLFSSTQIIAKDTNWEILSSYLSCPWFRKCPRFNYNFKLNSKGIAALGSGIHVKIGSHAGNALGQAVFGALLDEADFHVETKGKPSRAHDSYLAILRRMESRFLERGGMIPCKFWLISSPKNETAFLSSHILKQKERPDTRTYVVPTRPIWEIKSHLNIYSGPTFRVFLGDDTFDPALLEETDNRPLDPAKVVEVPIEYYNSFSKSLIESIRDIIGNPTLASTNAFPKPVLIDLAAVAPTRFTKQFVEIDYFDKDTQIEQFVQREYFLNPMNPECFRFIHVDNAYSEDRIGVSAIYAQSEYKVEETFNNVRWIEISRHDRNYVQDFALSFRRKSSSKEIPFHKLKPFFMWLKQIGYPIGKITFDQFQSKQLQQELEIEGFNVGHVSVDRTKTAYQALQASVAQRRIILCNHPVLVKELKELRDDGDKFDHLSAGSKDLADSVAGAHWTCSTEANIYVPSMMVKRSLTEYEVAAKPEQKFKILMGEKRLRF